MTGSGMDGLWLSNERSVYTEPTDGWGLWYKDGSRITSWDSDWASAPGDGIQVLVVVHPNGRKTITHGNDEYFLPGGDIGKLGAWTDNATYQRCVAEARQWRPPTIS